MKTAIIAALALTPIGGAACAQGAAVQPIRPAEASATGGSDKLRSKVAAVRAEITRISRDPNIPEEQRSARIDALVAEVEAERTAIAADMQSRAARPPSAPPLPGR
jgi:Spy/CpxP family protein refolding chaperone